MPNDRGPSGLFRKHPGKSAKLGEQAALYTKPALSGGFSVQTRWHKALGLSQEQRYYALVYVGKTDLAELLVGE
jgi:endonuclease YncB( thermonuclease family)